MIYRSCHCQLHAIALLRIMKPPFMLPLLSTPSIFPTAFSTLSFSLLRVLTFFRINHGSLAWWSSRNNLATTLFPSVGEQMKELAPRTVNHAATRRRSKVHLSAVLPNVTSPYYKGHVYQRTNRGGHWVYYRLYHSLTLYYTMCF